MARDADDDDAVEIDDAANASTAPITGAKAEPMTEGAGVGGQTRRVGAARPQQRRGRQLRRQRAHHRRRPIAAASASMSKKTAINFLFKPQFETPPKRGLFVGGGPHFDSIWKNSRLYHR